MVQKGMSVKLEEDSVHANHSIRALTVTSVLMDITAFLNANVMFLTVLIFSLCFETLT